MHQRLQCRLPPPPLAPPQVESFAQGLAAHQLARLPDGTTVLERSVTEHNVEAASKLYNNIYVEQLGALLGVAPDKAEAVACRMVMESRLEVGGWVGDAGRRGAPPPPAGLWTLPRVWRGAMKV